MQEYYKYLATSDSRLYPNQYDFFIYEVILEDYFLATMGNYFDKNTETEKFFKKAIYENLVKIKYKEGVFKTIIVDKNREDHYILGVYRNSQLAKSGHISQRIKWLNVDPMEADKSLEKREMGYGD